LSVFGGRAWEFDPQTGQYYYHAFLREQPDLNWRNPAVRKAMYDVLRFWLDRGVHGFRIDVLWHLIKDEAFRDDPPNPGYREGDAEHRRLLQLYSTDRPEVHDVVADVRALFNEYEERVMIGEIYLPIERLVRYYGLERPGVHLPFNFQLIHAPWNACEIDRMIAEYEKLVPEGEWPNWVLGNHDQHRIASRIGSDQARIAAMLLLTLRGTPTLYYGDEIGMEDVHIPPDRIQDPAEKNEPGLGLGRDPERTPMQWDASPHAGFSTTEPWLPLAEDYHRRNVKKLAEDSGSTLTLYKRLIELRRQHRALSMGDYARRMCEGHVMAYERSLAGERFLIALNFGADRESLPLQGAEGTISLSTYLDRGGERVSDRSVLRPNEGVVIALS
jgi:alpha-glucosidase